MELKVPRKGTLNAHAHARTELHMHIEGKRIAGAVCMASVQLETVGHFRSKMISEPTAEGCAGQETFYHSHLHTSRPITSDDFFFFTHMIIKKK